MSRHVTDFLSPAEIRELVRPSTLRALSAVLLSWGIIAASFALVIVWPNVLTVLVALVLLGGRQLGLLLLMHEAAHRSLLPSRALNDFVGQWFCGAPAWNDVERYRAHHLVHHAHTGTDRDPDLALVTPFPTSKRSLARKIMRDVFGIAGAKRILGLALMDFGYLHYTASGPAVRDTTPRSLGARLWLGSRRLFPVIVTNGLLAAVLVLLDAGFWYILWPIAYVTTFSLFLRLRSMAEHACTESTTDPFLNTRTTRANWIARLTVAPHQVNYHLEHHLLMTVPFYRLPEMHRLLRERGALDGCHLANGYGEVLEVMVG